MKSEFFCVLSILLIFGVQTTVGIPAIKEAAVMHTTNGLFDVFISLPVGDVFPSGEDLPAEQPVDKLQLFISYGLSQFETSVIHILDVDGHHKCSKEAELFIRCNDLQFRNQDGTREFWFTIEARKFSSPQILSQKKYGKYFPRVNNDLRNIYIFTPLTNTDIAIIFDLPAEETMSRTVRLTDIIAPHTIFATACDNSRTYQICKFPYVANFNYKQSKVDARFGQTEDFKPIIQFVSPTICIKKNMFEDS